MSTSLYWAIIPKKPEDRSLYELKRCLADKLWDSDGSSSQPEVIVDKQLIPYLEGIVAASRCDGKLGDKGNDAKELINAIKEHGKVKLSIQ